MEARGKFQASRVLALIGALLLAAATPAAAADLSVAPIYKVPEVKPGHYDWSGFYLGGNVGVSWDHREQTVYGGTGATLNSGTATPNSVTGGAQLGYNYALSPNWVIGVEADISGADLHTTLPAAGAAGQLDSKIDYFGTARGRLGYSFNNWLVYGTGGYAWAHEKFNFTAPGTFDSSSVVASGWAAGAGIEWGFTPNWSARLEYLHLGLDAKNVTFPQAGQSADTRSNADIVRAGVNYRFNWDR